MEQFLHTAEAARFLKRSEGAIRNLVMRRQIPYRKVAGRLVFLQSELEKWIQVAPGVTLDELQQDDY